MSFLSLLGNGLVKYIPPFGARQRLGKHVAAMRDNGRIVGRVFSPYRY
jgi:hypothetical protein